MRKKFSEKAKFELFFFFAEKSEKIYQHHCPVKGLSR
jgi:hypothetical protein